MLRCTQRRCAGALDHISRHSFSLQPKSCRFRPACEMQSKAFMRALRRSGSAAFPRNIRVVQTAKRHRRSRCLNWVEKLFSKERPLLAQSGRSTRVFRIRPRLNPCFTPRIPVLSIIFPVSSRRAKWSQSPTDKVSAQSLSVAGSGKHSRNERLWNCWPPWGDGSPTPSLF